MIVKTRSGKLFWICHPPKTAGGFLKHILCEAAAQKEIIIYPYSNLSFRGLREVLKPGGGQFYHCHYNELARLVSRESIENAGVIITKRDPVERFISLYNWLKFGGEKSTIPSNTGWRSRRWANSHFTGHATSKIRDVSLNQLLAQPTKYLDKYEASCQIDFLTGCEGDVIEVRQERLNDDLVKTCAALEINKPRDLIYKVHGSVKKEVALSKQQVRAVKDLYNRDYQGEFYE